MKKELYRNNLKNRDLGKEAPQNLDSERATIALRQCARENPNCEVKLTQSKTDFSSYFGILLQTLCPLFLFGSLSAAEHSDESLSPHSGLDSRISVLEAQMNEVCTQTVHGNYGAKTASASPQILGENWFFIGDMLWWHVNEGGNDYAVVYKELPLSSNTEAENRKLKFKWNWGFRAGVGTTFNHDRWDLQLLFTWFRAENSAASSLHGGEALIPTNGFVPVNGLNGNLGTQAKIHWNIHFYTLDLNLGRNYFISPKVAFHPFVGLKTACINQHQRTSARLFSPIVTRTSTKTRNEFWGIGPDLGVEGKWFIGCGFNLFGSVAAALMWGDFDVHQKQKSSATDSTVLRAKFDTHPIVPMTQMQIGIGYETNITHNQYRLSVNARYEEQYWWQQNQMPYFPLQFAYKYERQSEDLSLQGLTVDVRFDF